MTRRERVILPWACTFGHKSELNIAGKIILSPIIVLAAGTISLLELLFVNDDRNVTVTDTRGTDASSPAAAPERKRASSLFR